MSEDRMTRAERARYLIGRAVLERLAAFDKAMAEKSEPANGDLAAIEVRLWLDGAGFTAEEMQLLIDEAGIVIDPARKAGFDQMMAEVEQMMVDLENRPPDGLRLH